MRWDFEFEGEPRSFVQIYGNSSSSSHLHHVHTAGVSAGQLGLPRGNLRRNPTVAAPPTSSSSSGAAAAAAAGKGGGVGSPKSIGGGDGRTEITTETEFVTSSGTDEW